MRISEWGTTPSGETVHRLVLGSAPGAVLHVLTLGATVHRLEVEAGGPRRNIALGHRDPADYLGSSDYIGGTIGRYANRIAGGRTTLDEDELTLGAHDRGNHLHGGPDGFDRRVWEVVDAGADHAVLSLVSPDGDQGFPGTVRAQVTFTVTGHAVGVELAATTDAPTLVNLTSHAYFNLDGEGAGTIDEHRLTVPAERYTPVDATGIPLGDHAPVAGTAFDFRRPAAIGPRVRRDEEQIVLARGIDHNYVVDGKGWRTAAVLESPASGTRLTLRSDQPGLQVYTGNFLDGSRRTAEGGLYRQGDGIALEPQLHPDSPNRPDWPSAVLRPGETYRHRLEWELSAIGR
ncbi:aldose epimerase family protein [Nocardioides sp. cx-173]|uniref:aldose epimerase family protein n=1 Tax=Nocardioides sp. cx-173 TaxID=2898796 RepID=UPI001E30423E|nr:aldose epimerase family protein [Nocardioides sp. cx-173]MCD4523481.1 galactose mutarotase [Nocardioides sp. cx-173]UGB42180.1 galactose mutarotase [Nocardioides sp. cx-173]